MALGAQGWGQAGCQDTTRVCHAGAELTFGKAQVGPHAVAAAYLQVVLELKLPTIMIVRPRVCCAETVIAPHFSCDSQRFRVNTAGLRHGRSMA